MPENWAEIPVPDEALDGEIVQVSVGDTDLALACVDGTWFGFPASCTHAFCLFEDFGELDGTTLICNCHGAEFDLRTGEVLLDPAEEPLKMHNVERHGQILRVQTDP